MDAPLKAVFAALADEIRITKSRMQVDESVFVKPAHIVKGAYGSVPLILARTGVGREAMARAVTYCIENFHPDVSINVGYCGGARPELTAGDLIVAHRVVDARTGEELTMEGNLVDELVELCKRADIRCSADAVVTVDAVVGLPLEKAFMGTKHEVGALDMESHAFAKACQGKDARCAVVRAVLDPMDMTLPNFEGAIDEEGETSVMGAVKNLVLHPRDIFAIPRVEYCAGKAREAIAQLVDAWCCEK